jgi:hypothetical protein
MQLKFVVSALNSLHSWAKMENGGRKVSWIVKWYGKYGNKVSRIVIRYGQYERKESWIVIRFGKYGRKLWWIVKWYGKYGRKEGKYMKNPEENSDMIGKIQKKLWKDMENMEERQVQ